MMSNFKFAFPLTLVAASLLAASCSGTNSPFTEAGGVTAEPGVGAPPSTKIGFYASLNGGTAGAAIKGIGDDLRSTLQSVAGGQDQNVLFDKNGAGTLFITGSVGGVTSVNTLRSVAGRSAAYGTAGFGDTTATYAAITGAKGLTALGTSVATANRFVIADATGATNALHVVNKSDTGASAPVFSITVAALGGNAWDSAYDAAADRLFVARTNGTVAVYDLFSTLSGSAAPNRTITPGVIMDNPTGTATPTNPADDVSSKISFNFHGIAYSAATNILVVSDVGAATMSTQAGFDTDGQIFTIGAASTKNDTASAGAGSVAIVTAKSRYNGSNTMLGNPVDLILNGPDAIVAEKANGGGFNLLRFANILVAAGGNIRPSALVVGSAAAGRPESITKVE